MMIVALALLLAAAPAGAAQTEADAYTRYELLDPATAKFRIIYDVSATTPGATRYYNPIRPGSTASDERVTDASTGRPLVFSEVSGDVAVAGGVGGALPANRYIEVVLARAVPPDGAARLRIDKTYADAKSYFREGDAIVFERSLGIRRNAVVLPLGYELSAVNLPSQILQERDGRIKLSFINTGPGPAALRLSARRARLAATPSSLADKLDPVRDERAAQTRNIVYYLNDPATNAFALTHDYTETRAGTATYVNEVRTGSTVSNPSGTDLDTGAPLGVRVVAMGAAQSVIFDFPAVRPGETRRLRIAETYTDPARYRLVGDELVWERSLGRPANAVVLPPGWLLTNSSVPATVITLPDGRIRLDFVNPRLDELATIVTARRR